MVEEGAAPGFLGHTHSHLHAHEMYVKPIEEDFPEWTEYGARYIPCPWVIGAAFSEDDTWIGFKNCVLDPEQEEAIKLIARFSERDAETFQWLWNKFTREGWKDALYEELFNPPPPPGVASPLEKIMFDPASGFDPLWTVMSPIEVCMDLFESPEAQNLFVRTCQSIGQPADLSGGVWSVLYQACWDAAVVVGGNHREGYRNSASRWHRDRGQEGSSQRRLPAGPYSETHWS